MTQEKRIKVGVVGLGRNGWGHHVRVISQKPETFELVAAVDPLAERRKEASDTHGCATYEDIDAMLSDGKAELAVISTLNTDHCAHTIKALEAGLHVVVEKPMALSVAQAQSMIAAAKRAKRVLTVHQNARSNESMRFVREVMDSGILGQVFWMRFGRHTFTRRNDWQVLRKFGGGYMNNNGTHSIDFCLMLMDAPVKDVWGTLKHTVTAGDADDFMKIAIRGQNDRVIEVEESYACAFPQPLWLVTGTCGTLQITGKTAQIKFFDPARVAPQEVLDSARQGRRFGNDDKLPWEEKTMDVKVSTPYPDFYDNLYCAIRQGEPLLVTPESVLQTVTVQELARKSAGWTD